MQTVTVQTLAAKTPLRAKTNKGQFCLKFSTFHTMNCWAEIQTGLTVMGALLYEKIKIITLVGEERSNLLLTGSRANAFSFFNEIKIPRPLQRTSNSVAAITLLSQSPQMNASDHGENSYYHFSMSFIPPLESQLYLDIPQNAAKFVKFHVLTFETYF